MKYIFKISIAIVLMFSWSCEDFLDVTPDNIATIDYAFRMRNTAERFLFTCYSYMPSHASNNENIGLLAGDESWLVATNTNNLWQIARGNQRVVNPYANAWQGTLGSRDLYQGIRECNVFLENIHLVPDISDFERVRWISEVKFLKAYYHFYLIRMYGPIVLIKENLPVSASPEEVRIPRSPVDECFDYVIQLLDESLPDLPDRIESEVSELGRITKTINLSLKAKVLVTAASPLFNGNPDYTGFSNKDGTLLFNTEIDETKWQKAADACKVAIDFAESQGHELYEYSPQLSQFNLSDTTLTQMSIRNAFNERWNSEVIWANTNSIAVGLQANGTPRGLDPAQAANSGPQGNLAPPLKIAELYYSDNGVPIEEDVTWDYNNRFNLRIPGYDHRFNLKQGYTTVQLHFDRENRYYASLGFDGGIWYGQGRFDDESDDILYVSSKQGQPAAPINLTSYSVTGFFTKKWTHFQSVIGTGNTFTREGYPWPIMKLNDLYLLYAEALNEVSGPSEEVYTYINKIRARAGLQTVQASWSVYSNNPTKYTTQAGLREIIQRERSIELMFEGQRFWDLRRWKTATTELNKPITGWDLFQESPEGYYREQLIYNQTFRLRDYLWPINENALLANPALVQNPGW